MPSTISKKWFHTTAASQIAYQRKMKRPHAGESTVTVRISHAAASTHDATVTLTVHVSQEELAASSPLLGGIAEDVNEGCSDVVLDVKVQDAWAVPIMANLIENREVGRIFNGEPSLVTTRLVDLYHALDKYEMSWAMDAFHTRLICDIQTGILGAMSVFDAYRGHFCISRLLVGMVDIGPEVMWLNPAQLQMIMLSKSVRCALVLSQRRDEDNYYEDSDTDPVFYAMHVICKIPETQSALDDADYIPGGLTGFWIRRYCGTEMEIESPPPQWLVINCDEVTVRALEPDKWIGVESNRKNYYDGSDYEMQASMFYDLEDACESIGHRVEALVDHSGTVLHRASCVRNSDLKCIAYQY